MKKTSDEFGFTMTAEDTRVSEESNLPSEFALSDDSFSDREYTPLPKEHSQSSGQTETEAAADRHKLLKKMIYFPVASAIATVSILCSAMGVDPLKALSMEKPDAKPPVQTEPPEISAPPMQTGPPEISAPPVHSGPTDTPHPPVYSDAFPALPNMEPDFAGNYAWSGQGSEEYVLVVEGEKKTYLHAGSYYASLPPEYLGDVTGATYNKETNVLTLNNFDGVLIETNLMGNSFTIELIGENSVGRLVSWGAMYGGSVTFTGSGSLTVNESGENSVGILLNCENSPSCIMIDREVTLTAYGEPAIMISSTTLAPAIYCLEPVKPDRGEIGIGAFVVMQYPMRDENGEFIYDEEGNMLMQDVTVYDISSGLYDASVLNEDGQPLGQVTFSNEKGLFQ